MDLISELADDLLRALRDEEFEHAQRLVRVAPLLALVLEPLLG